MLNCKAPVGGKLPRVARKESGAVFKGIVAPQVKLLALPSLAPTRSSQSHVTSLQATPTPVVHAAAVAERPTTKEAKPEGRAGSNSQGTDYQQAERNFVQLLASDNLDKEWLQHQQSASPTITSVEKAIEGAIAAAYGPDAAEGEASESAHTFLQRLLYRVNRLNLFWYDDLENYRNERSMYLAILRNKIEDAWQAWDMKHMDVATISKMDVEQVKEALRSRAAHDVNPPLSEVGTYISNEMGREGYKHLLKIGSLDGLVEASRQSKICGGAANEIQCTIFRVLAEEYGNGRLPRKHSTFFAAMMTELGLETKEETYFDTVPWQVLASINHNFLLTERRRHYLRYNGGLTFFEVNGPSVYRTYLNAAQRNGLSDVACGYWELHIREDERHGRQMVEEVAVPLAEKYAKDSWEVLLGYDQEKFMGDRAALAVMAAIKQAEVDAGRRAISSTELH